MSKTMKALLASLLMTASVGAAFLPDVGTGTDPNHWTRNMDGVLAAAKTTGYPIFLVMVNEASDGTGCSHCKDFMVNTINTDNFRSIVNDYKFYMVFLNIWGADTAGSQPAYGGVSSAYFMNYFRMYAASQTSYPCVAVIKPDGSRYAAWSHGGNPSTKAPILHTYIRAAIAALAVSDTIFSLEAPNGTAISVTPPAVATWAGQVVRSGASGKDGTVTLSLSGANAQNYALDRNSFAWGTQDGTVSFTVTGPYSSDGGIVDDFITVSMSASGFSGSTISYGTTAQTIRFRDSRIAQTLDEFGAVSGIDGLSSDSGVWYKPVSSADGNVLQTFTKGSSVMVWRPSTGGFVTLSSNVSAPATRSTAVAPANKGSLTVSINGGAPYDLAQFGSIRLGFSTGDAIVFTATAPVQGVYAEIGLTKFDVSKFVVSITSPANGAVISLPQLINNHALADLGWSADRSCNKYEVLDAAGNVLWPTTETGINGIDIGLVSLDVGSATYNWGVRGYYDCSNEQSDNGVSEISTVAWSSFTVASSPKFGVMPSAVTAYLKLNTSIDFAAREGSSDGVSYAASGLPKGMKINPATGLISGIPKKAGTYNVSVTATNSYGSDTVTFTLKVAKQLKAAKANVQLILFDGSGNIVGSALFKSTMTGKWTLKTTKANGTASASGTLSVSGTGTLQVSGKGVSLSGDMGSGLWTGTVSGYSAYGTKIAKLSRSWQGVWNGGVGTSANDTLAGYISAKVASGGKVSTAGKISGKGSIGGGSFNGVLLSSSFVATYLPAWAGHGDAVFVHLNKKRSMNGGYALFSDGTLRGSFTRGGVAYDKMEGGKWTKPSLAGFNGATVSTVGCGNVSFAVSAKAASVSAAKNAIKAKVSINKNTGLARVSYRNGRTVCNGSGAAYVSGGVLQVLGGGSGGKAKFAFMVR